VQVAESEWDKADIERENTAQGSPRASWKPIVLDKGELRHAVDKGKLKQSKSRCVRCRRTRLRRALRTPPAHARPACSG
jgi:hypothetical protein